MNTSLNNHNGTNNQYPDFTKMQAYADKSAKARGDAFFSGVHYLKQVIRKLHSNYKTYQQEQRAIKELSRLSPEMLNDIGISKNDIDRVQVGAARLESLVKQRALLLASTATASHARKQGLWLVDLKIKALRDLQHHETRKVA